MMAAGVVDRYNDQVEAMRKTEYPMLKGMNDRIRLNCELTLSVDGIYLDHAGTALPAKSLLDRFAADLTSNLYGNPHSASSTSMNTAQRVDSVRLKLLALFNADPEEFDLVFVANATAGIKLVMEAFRDFENGFWYGYHKDSHTSLVGVREAAKHHQCFASDTAVEEWVSSGLSSKFPDVPHLLAYPAQSNLNGRRLPLEWCASLRARSIESGQPIYSLLDAAAYVSTSSLDLSNADTAPDFTVLSLYKMFGFPDLGALIVRRASGHVFRNRKYFGGGTVDMVLCIQEQWHAKNSESLHGQLEDGTLPIHSIIAAEHAMIVHHELFGPLERISQHTMSLAQKLYDGLRRMKHANDVDLCEVYTDLRSDYTDSRTQGPIVTFNMRNSSRAWIGTGEVEKLAAVKDINLRTGAMCNPGGTASYLQLKPWEMRQNLAAGQRCGVDAELDGGKPTGMIRLSLGAMSTLKDVHSFLGFIDEFFVEHKHIPVQTITPSASTSVGTPFVVESLTVYPIKSCAGWRIPWGASWAIRPEGLTWDREWCLVHSSSGVALSQKQYPRMALIRPSIDFEDGVLRIGIVGSSEEVTVPLSANPMQLITNSYTARNAKVCGDPITAQVYASPTIAAFFTRAVGVQCQLARFPASSSSALGRHSKAHLQMHQTKPADLGTIEKFVPGRAAGSRARPILLSNESPILVINRSSLNRLNEKIKATGGKAAHAEVFRANIVVAEHAAARPGLEQPYVEDEWRALQIGQQRFEMLGSCRRCQMVCVDQETAIKNQEPFTTLAKTRRFNGKVLFGQHACHVPVMGGATPADQHPTIRVGDQVQTFWKYDDLH